MEEFLVKAMVVQFLKLAKMANEEQNCTISKEVEFTIDVGLFVLNDLLVILSCFFFSFFRHEGLELTPHSWLVQCVSWSISLFL